MTDWRWLQLVADLAPIVLRLIPGAAPLAPIVAVGIQTAESMPFASSTDKLAHAQRMVIEGAAATTASGAAPPIDPMLAQHVAAEAISTIVDMANQIHQAHAPQPA